MAGKDDHPASGGDRLVYMLKAVRLDAAARLENADLPEARIFRSYAPEIVPHAANDACDLALRGPGKGAPDVTPGALGGPKNGPFRRPIAPPRAEAQSSGNAANAPNNNAAPQASK